MADANAWVNVAITQLTQAIVEATKCPQPSYSVEGQSVSYGEYMAQLISGLEKLQQFQAKSQPYDIRSVGV